MSAWISNPINEWHLRIIEETNEEKNRGDKLKMHEWINKYINLNEKRKWKQEVEDENGENNNGIWKVNSNETRLRTERTNGRKEEKEKERKKDGPKEFCAVTVVLMSNWNSHV